MNKLIYILLFTVSISFSEIIDEEPKISVDCLILQDENSIICKYEHERIEEDKNINVQWIDPNGEVSRERILLIPAGHGSIYDFRYIEGREKGIWQFKVIDGEVETSATFEIE
ncbi:MAG: hypothetical protein C0625_10020 [Arcobacter sp.]|mgnify:CR=1 FL=1|nr:MAG: hypothetical protein C0625_10020 [Arcobacter sp.]